MGSSVVDVGPRLAVALAVLAAVAGRLARRGDVEAALAWAFRGATPSS
jgi:hypothetical protein